MPISTDPQLIDQLLTRGVENIYPNREYLEARLKEGKRLSLYVGYDPTAPSFHIGHAITLLKLRQFQELGHDIIMLIGDFTAMIGDPTDKSGTRKRLTHEEALANSQLYQQQASAILHFDGENPARVLYNHDWLGKMSFADVVELSAHFTVQQMMHRDMFRRREEENKEIYLHEFLYPLMQGYDCVAMDVDGEVGGNDQTFNMLAGRTLMKEMKGKEKFCLSTKLLTDTSGKKMGKTEGNMVSLSDSPEDVFGKVMRWTDGMIVNGFELCTRLPMEEIKQMEQRMAAGENPRDFKLRLAYEITKTFLGEDAATKGRDHFSTVIQQKSIPDDMPVVEVAETTMNIVDLVAHAGLAKTKSEARRVVEEGGVSVEQEVIRDIAAMITIGKGVTVQKGKRHYTRVMPK